MYLYRVLYFVCILLLINLAACNPVAPTAIVGTFHGPAQHKDLRILIESIEERLTNLDSIYNMQLIPSLESKLQHYQRKLDGLDAKLIQSETLIMEKLDRMSDNISGKNFKDDVTQTDIFHKIETAYNGISHKLAYMDRKLENTLVKLQEKSIAILGKLEKIDDTVTIKEENLQDSIDETIQAIDDLKSQSFSKLEQLEDTAKTLNASLRNQERIFKIQGNIINNTLTEQLKSLQTTAQNHFNLTKSQGSSRKVFENDFKETMNDYANKVADMNNDVSKMGVLLLKSMSSVAASSNSSKIELQNGIRSLMIQLGKIEKDNIGNQNTEGYNLLYELNDKLEKNFETIISTQNLFLESCHRLQMDESQIESQISNILEKLIENVEKQSRKELNDIKNVEKLLRNHDFNVQRNLHQTSANLITLHDKANKEIIKFDNQIKDIKEHLRQLHKQMEHANLDSNSNEITSALHSVEKQLNLLKKLNNVSNSHFKQKVMQILDDQQFNQTLIKSLQRQLSDIYNITTEIQNVITSKVIDLKLGEVSVRIKNETKTILDSFLNKLNKSTSYHQNKNNSEIVIDEEARSLINEIFQINTTSEINNNSDSKRIQLSTNCSNNQLPPAPTEQSATEETMCLDFDIDVRFNPENPDTTERKRKCKKIPV